MTWRTRALDAPDLRFNTDSKIPARLECGALSWPEEVPLLSAQVLWVDPHSGLKTMQNTLRVDRGVNYASAQQRLAQDTTPGSGFYVSRRPWFGRFLVLLAIARPGGDHALSICRPNTGARGQRHAEFVDPSGSNCLSTAFVAVKRTWRRLALARAPQLRRREFFIPLLNGNAHDTLHWSLRQFLSSKG